MLSRPPPQPDLDDSELVMDDLRATSGVPPGSSAAFQPPSATPNRFFHPMAASTPNLNAISSQVLSETGSTPNLNAINSPVVPETLHASASPIPAPADAISATPRAFSAEHPPIPPEQTQFGTPDQTIQSTPNRTSFRTPDQSIQTTPFRTPQNATAEEFSTPQDTSSPRSIRTQPRAQGPRRRPPPPPAPAGSLPQERDGPQTRLGPTTTSTNTTTNTI